MISENTSAGGIVRSCRAISVTFNPLRYGRLPNNFNYLRSIGGVNINIELL